MSFSIGPNAVPSLGPNSKQEKSVTIEVKTQLRRKKTCLVDFLLSIVDFHTLNEKRKMNFAAMTAEMVFLVIDCDSI